MAAKAAVILSAAKAASAAGSCNMAKWQPAKEHGESVAAKAAGVCLDSGGGDLAAKAAYQHLYRWHP